jgi:hypothetical protein
MSSSDNELNINLFKTYYPLPNLPPWGKEYHARLFPLGGNGKGGYLN